MASKQATNQSLKHNRPNGEFSVENSDPMHVQSGTMPTDTSNGSRRDMIEGNNQPARSEEGSSIHIGHTIPFGTLGYGIDSEDYSAIHIGHTIPFGTLGYGIDSEDYSAIHIGHTIPFGTLNHNVTSDDNLFEELVMLQLDALPSLPTNSKLVLSPPRSFPLIPKNSEWLPSAQ